MPHSQMEADLRRIRHRLDTMPVPGVFRTVLERAGRLEFRFCPKPVVPP